MRLKSFVTGGAHASLDFEWIVYSREYRWNEVGQLHPTISGVKHLRR